MKDEALHQLIECARLLGQTQAKKGFGTHTQQDSRFELAMYKSINENEAKIKEALAQPEQEPVAYATKEDFRRELEHRLKHIREEMKIKSVTMRCKDYDIALPIIDTAFGRVLVGQVSTPPQRKPLTDEQIDSIALDYSLPCSTRSFARAIEAAHDIKE